MSAEPDMNPEPESRERSWFESGTIETLEEASWCARKLRRHRQTLAEVEALYTAERERLDRWIEHERARVGADATRFEVALTSWHRRRLMAGEAEKTVRLPAATLKARQLPDRVEVADEQAFLSWAETGGWNHTYRVKKQPDKRAILEHVKTYGEVPDGTEVVPGDLSLTVVTDDRTESPE